MPVRFSPMTRSLPEKTFEHWCTIHLTYRYRAHLDMWWPATGADIQVAAIPGAYGKRIWLELKTVEWNRAQARHDLTVDLKQLGEYGRQGIPDYYVFPIPKWQGELGDATSAAWLASLAPSSLAYQTRSHTKWFAQWTYVVPGRVLRRALTAEVTAAMGGGVRYMRIAEVRHAKLTWLPASLRGTTPLLWKKFWELMERCGSSDYPAQFVLPPGAVVAPSGATGPIPRATLRSILKSVAGKSLETSDGATQGVSFYSPIGQDQYEALTLDASINLTDFVWEDPERVLVLLAAKALRI